MLLEGRPTGWDQTREVSKKSMDSSCWANNLHSSSTRHCFTNQPGCVLYGITLIYPNPDNKYTPQARGCRKLPSYVPYKGTYVPYDGTFGAPDQGQTLDV